MTKDEIQQEIDILKAAMIEHIKEGKGGKFSYTDAAGNHWDFDELDTKSLNAMISGYDKRLALIAEVVADRPTAHNEVEEMALKIADLLLEEEKFVAEHSRKVFCDVLDQVMGV